MVNKNSYESPKGDCNICVHRENCASKTLRAAGIKHETVVFKKKETIFEQGERLKHFYIIKSGSVKLCDNTKKGPLTMNFSLNGEYFGAEGINEGKAGFTAIAMEKTVACVFTSEEIIDNRCRHPELHSWELDILCESLKKEQDWIRVISKISADAKIAAFILNLANRNYNAAFDKKIVPAVIKRWEMAEAANMATETFSRILTKLSNQEIVQIEPNRIKINNIDYLGRLFT